MVLPTRGRVLQRQCGPREWRVQGGTGRGVRGVCERGQNRQDLSWNNKGWCRRDTHL